MTSDDFLGLVMFGLLFALLTRMVLDGIKTRRIYKHMEDEERIERAERAERNAGVGEVDRG